MIVDVAGYKRGGVSVRKHKKPTYPLEKIGRVFNLRLETRRFMGMFQSFFLKGFGHPCNITIAIIHFGIKQICDFCRGVKQVVLPKFALSLTHLVFR